MKFNAYFELLKDTNSKMKFSYNSTVTNTLDEVWKFIMDFERRPEWIQFYDKSFITEQTPNWLGTKYKEKLTFLGFPMFIEYEIFAYEEKKMWKSKCNMKPFYPIVHVEVEDLGNGKIANQLTFDIKIPGPLKLIPKKIDSKAS